MASEQIDPWQLFDIESIRTQLAPGVVAYKEFLRVPSLHCGLYQLPKGAADMQTPHEEDEVYYVLEGRAQMRLGSSEGSTVQAVKPGTVLHVQATETHSFFEIEEDMLLLVIFATNAPGAGA
ncbi:MAG: cupin domain-containing protein [Pseudomonadales bacterium]